MKYLYIIAILITGLLTADSPQEIRVLLDTQSCLSPIYLSGIECIDDSFSEAYVKELEKILQFDFNHNGKTKVAARTKEKDLLLTSSDQKSTLLKGIETPFALSFSLKQKKLHCRIYS